jgi:hypothetical protein
LAGISGWNSGRYSGVSGNIDYPEYRNKSGFSAFPGGRSDENGMFYSIGNLGFWWSASELSSYFALFRNISSRNSDVGYKVEGYS